MSTYIEDVMAADAKWAAMKKRTTELRIEDVNTFTLPSEITNKALAERHLAVWQSRFDRLPALMPKSVVRRYADRLELAHKILAKFS